MPKSFIKFKPVTASSERHNLRKISPKYLIENAAANIHIVDCSIAERFAKIEINYIKNRRQKMQAKATPIREAVILLPDDDNDKNLENLFTLNDFLNQKYGLQAFQVHIHNDEGHIDKDGKAKYNYHAHVVYDWTDERGINLNLNRKDMSDIQTLTAECLSMTRGEVGSKNLSLNHREYRGFMLIKDKIEKSLKMKLDEKIEKEIREVIKNERPIKIAKDERNQNNRTDSRGIVR